MTLAELQSSLDKLGVSLETTEAFERFRATTGSGNIQAFVDYLHETGVISDETYRLLQPDDDIDFDDFQESTELGEDAGVPGGSGAVVAPESPGPEAAGAAIDIEHETDHFHHKIMGQLGKGAAGIIYLARDLDLRRKVAYKRLQPHLSADSYVVSHFKSEVQITAQLDHPNIVPVYAMHRAPDGAPAYTMKFIRGKTLLTLMNEARVLYRKGEPIDDEHSLTSRLEIFLKVCDAVAYAHSKGVIHRDLKPENIMIGTFNQVYVVDWGIAKVLSRDEQRAREIARQEIKEQIELVDRYGSELDVAATQMGAVVGSVRYMSPEQATCDNDAVDARSDQYSLGVVLHELVAMRRAVEGDTFYELLTKVGTGQHEPLEHIDPRIKIPRELRAIVNRATAFRREDRYDSVAEMADDIRRYMRGEAIRALPDTLPRRLFRWMQHNKESTLAILSFLLLLSTAAVSISVIETLRTQKDVATARRAVAEERRIAVEKARVRSEKLDRFLSRVAEARSGLDRHFLMVQSLLQGLANAAVQAIAHGRPTGEKTYSHLEFSLPGRAPPDFAPSSHYHRPVSFDWPVFKLAPGVTRRQVRPLLSRIAHLRHLFKSLFLASVGVDPASVKREEVARLLGEQGAPIFWAFIGLRQGVMFSYPGKTGYPAAFDPRTRPWYELAEGKRHVVWGNPYIDTMGGGLLLPAAMALFDERGRFLGVAGMECTFDYIIEHLMSLADDPEIDETFIVDDKARVVVRSSDRHREFEAGQLHDALELPPLPIPEVAIRIKSGHAGALEINRQGKPKLVAHYPLNALGWHYVVQAEASILE